MRLNRNVRRFSQPLSLRTCAEKLTQNDPGFVELSLERLGDDFDLEDFIHAIRINATVKHVCFSGTFVRELSQEQWSVMLENIGHLQTLEELQIWCSTVDVGVLRHTLQHATSLRKVYFFRVTLAGDQVDFDHLALSLQNHGTLRDFRVGGFQTSDPAISLDKVVEALAVAPSLQVVSLQLTGFQTTVPFSGRALSTLMHSATVKDLYLSRLGLCEEHFRVIAAALAVNKVLRVLDLFGNNVENEHVVLIAEALVTNESLITLVLPCPTDDLSMPSCQAISKALQINKTLATLNLPRSNLNDEGLLEIVAGLTVNTTLKKVEVGVKKELTSRGVDGLMQMLEKNYELERLVVSSAEKSVQAKVEYYMRLNEVGRGTLLKNGTANRHQWIDMLISVSDDLDCLFYFVSHNPTLCLYAQTEKHEVIITEEFRPRRRHTLSTSAPPPPEGATSSIKKDRANLRCSSKW